MKNLLIILFILFCVSGARSQSFLFEDAAVPTGWVAMNGTLTLSTEHIKEGAQSLCWETSGNSLMNVTFSSFISSTGNSAFM